jgi:hypothetical protein
MSLSSEFIFGCVHFFAATFELEQRASLHQGKDAPCSGVTKGMRPSWPPHFFKIFQKIPTTFVETDRTSERFLTETKTRERKRWWLAWDDGLLFVQSS